MKLPVIQTCGECGHRNFNLCDNSEAHPPSGSYRIDPDAAPPTWCPLRTGPDAAELRAAPPTTYLHADGTEEPIGELVARLTRERDGLRSSAATQHAAIVALTEERDALAERDAHARAHHDAYIAQRDQATADLAETRAQLARLREAAEDLGDAVRGAVHAEQHPELANALWEMGRLLSTPGPTLDTTRAEALRWEASCAKSIGEDRIANYLIARANEIGGNGRG